MWFCTRDECNGHRLRFVLFEVNFEIETESFRLLFDRDASHFHMATRIGCRENWKINVINWLDRQKKLVTSIVIYVLSITFVSATKSDQWSHLKGYFKTNRKTIYSNNKKWWHYEFINTNEVVRMSLDLLRISIHQSRWKWSWRAQWLRIISGRFNRLDWQRLERVSSLIEKYCPLMVREVYWDCYAHWSVRLRLRILIDVWEIYDSFFLHFIRSLRTG